MNRYIERIVTWSILLLGMNFFVAVIYGTDIQENTVGSINTGEMRPEIAVVYVSIFVLCAVFALRRYKTVLGAFRLCWPLMMFVGFAFLSTAWSVQPGVTFRRSLFFLGTTSFGIYLGARYEMRALNRLLLQAYAILLLFSLFFYAVAPSYVLDGAHQGALQGLSGHKNNFGEQTALIICLLLNTRAPLGKRILKIVCVVVCFGLMLLSRSGSSIVVCTVVLALIPVLRVIRSTKLQRFPIFVFVGSILFSLFYMFSNSWDNLLDFLGKDRTLTGRSEIWAAVLVAISRRPLLGYGFDAFWQGPKGDSLQILAAVGWLVAHSHDGYLQLLLDMGIIGMAIFAVLLVVYFKRALAFAEDEEVLDAFWPMTFIVFFLLHAIPEATLVTRQSLNWLVFCSLYASLAVYHAKKSKSQVVHPAPRFGVPRAYGLVESQS